MWKAALMVLALAGCATPEPERVTVIPKQAWWKPEGFQPADFERDAGKCRAQAFAIPDARPDRVRIVYEGCLQGMGYRLHPNQPKS